MHVITLPRRFGFRDANGVFDFNNIINFFDWDHSKTQIVIDLRNCMSADYQALSLLVLYIWKLKTLGIRIEILSREDNNGATQMWRKMGSFGLFEVLFNEKANFRSSADKPLIAIRNRDDFSFALGKIENYTSKFDVEYNKTLRYVISELLYNTLEHGRNIKVPSVIQYNWYKHKNEISFIIGDLGIGIKKHIEQAYPGFENDIDAIFHATKPQVSGTFGKSSGAYESKNNAGVGLFLSTNIIRKLRANMYIVSGSGLLHVSPMDITKSTLESRWPGTFIYVSIMLGSDTNFSLHSMMSEFREAAKNEIASGSEIELSENLYINVYNFFGKHAEIKEDAIRYRDKHIIPAIREGKKVLLDFETVESAPHSFLSALMATPIVLLGYKAYKHIKIINALPEIRETLDFILDENTN